MVSATVSATMDLASEALPASSSRHFVRDMLARQQLPAALIEDAELVVSELVANAVEHGKGATTLRVSLELDRLRVEVGDRSVERPLLLRPDRVEPRHRGMMIVDNLSAHWGCGSNGAGKTVWAEWSCMLGA